MPSAQPLSSPDLTIRPATKADVPEILSMIRELADYEKLAHEVVATQEGLETTLFGTTSYAQVLIALWQGQVAGFSLFFHNYSTFLAKPGLYIEDVFVRPDFRAHGIGKALFSELASIARARNCGRMEWWVLDWNTPAIAFYNRMGAAAMDEWTVYRLTAQQLETL
jgi:GNAT superfamily N-acetyltransferase